MTSWIRHVYDKLSVSKGCNITQLRCRNYELKLRICVSRQYFTAIQKIHYK